LVILIRSAGIIFRGMGALFRSVITLISMLAGHKFRDFFDDVRMLGGDIGFFGEVS